MATNEWQVTIKAVTNGFVAEYAEEGENGTLSVRTEVFEEIEEVGDLDSSLDGMEKLLYFIMEFFGATGSRYSKERLRIIREPGDKYSESEDESLAD